MKEGKEDLVDQLLKIPNIDIIAKDKHGNSAFDYAKAAKHENMIVKLTPLALEQLAGKVHIPSYLASEPVRATSTNTSSVHKLVTSHGQG